MKKNSARNLIRRHINHLNLNETDTRLDYFRNVIVPWINNIIPIENLKILEIGCGTGSSTLAFAEKGATISAIDLNEDYILEAKTKTALFSSNIKFYIMNASELGNSFQNSNFDLIVFMASLEHMTIEERITSLKSAYQLLPENKFLCISGTPNRLHFLDSHTSHIPFFHWLPDKLAIEYSKLSTREQYRDHIQKIEDENEKLLQLYRWGRGISFHEIELAIKPIKDIKIISNLNTYRNSKEILYAIISKFTLNYFYTSLLKKRFPDINRAFMESYLNLIIRKD